MDIRTPKQAIEVEVDPSKFKEGLAQLRNSTKACYLAVPNDLVKEAKEAATGTGVGIMNAHGTIKKRAH